eukprot:COSAG02_NODE_42818_length_381_cov_0.549645_1_plen_35_part_10
MISEDTEPTTVSVEEKTNVPAESAPGVPTGLRAPR